MSNVAIDCLLLYCAFEAGQIFMLGLLALLHFSKLSPSAGDEQKARAECSPKASGDPFHAGQHFTLPEYFDGAIVEEQNDR